jgi:hypothetical protein
MMSLKVISCHLMQETLNISPLILLCTVLHKVPQREIVVLYMQATTTSREVSVLASAGLATKCFLNLTKNSISGTNAMDL